MPAAPLPSAPALTLVHAAPIVVASGSQSIGARGAPAHSASGSRPLAASAALNRPRRIIASKTRDFPTAQAGSASGTQAYPELVLPSEGIAIVRRSSRPPMKKVRY